MSDAIQLLLLFLAWVLIALGCHLTIRHYFAASLLAACAMVAAQQLAGYLQVGTLDPLWYLSTLIGFAMASIVALVIGLPFRVVRSLQHAGKDGDAG